MSLLADLVYQMIAPPAVLQAVFIKLTVDGVNFTRGIFLGKQRLPKKTAEAVERPIKCMMADLKKIIRDIRSRIGVAGPGIGVQIFLKRTDFGIFFGSKKKHVLQIMSQSLLFPGIIQLTDPHRQSGRAPVHIGIMHEQNLQSVIQNQGTGIALGGIGGSP